MTDERFAEHAASFDRAADVYERARPSYPVEAAEWLVADTARDVLDLGAGTGKFTRLLVRSSRNIVAVDPAERMLAQLADAVPGVRTLAGSGEHIPLPDGSIDAVTVAQAWHWFDHGAAVPEIARVLRPGGTLGLIWNMRDESVDWVAHLMGIIGDSKSDVLIADPHLPGAPFGASEYRQFSWSNTVDRQGILDLVASRSMFIVSDDATKHRVLGEVEALLDSHPDLVGLTEYAMPYRVNCFRAVRD